MPSRYLLASLVCLIACPSIHSADVNAAGAAASWPTWRGPAGNGVVSGAFPTEWKVENGTGPAVRWKVPMTGPGGSTPIVWGERIFLTAGRDGKNVAQCFDWQGKLLWETAIGDERPGKHKKASGCNPSPVTDGQHLFVYYKSGDFACLDLDGKIVWQQNLQQKFGEDTLWWDLGTSPILTREHVVVAVVQSGPSYLAAFDKLSGDVAWKVDRTLDAPEEANQTYSTPIVIDRDGIEMLVMLGADHVTAHNAANGKELWRVGGFNPEQNGYFRSIASAVYTEGVIVVPYARGKTLTGLSLDGKILWQGEEISSDVPTPAAIDGKVYVCADKGTLACLDAKTGKSLWTVDTGRNRNAFSASPILAGEHLYLTREDGTVFVIPRDRAEIVATNEMDEFTVATPVFVDGNILIRTTENLYCIGAR